MVSLDCVGKIMGEREKREREIFVVWRERDCNDDNYLGMV